MVSPEHHHVARIVAHGVVSGTASVARGGKFQSGFLAGSVVAFAGPAISDISAGLGSSSVFEVIADAVIGGASAELGGGNFKNGAISGAFQRLYAIGSQELLENPEVQQPDNGRSPTSVQVACSGDNCTDGAPRYNVNLLEHELEGGHTLRLHGAKSIGFLFGRLMSNNHLNEVSTFFSLRQATGLINKTLNFSSELIDTMMGVPGGARLVVEAHYDRPTGYHLSRGGKPVTVNTVRIILEQPAATKEGFLIRSAFPTRP